MFYAERKARKQERQELRQQLLEQLAAKEAKLENTAAAKDAFKAEKAEALRAEQQMYTVQEEGFQREQDLNEYEHAMAMERILLPLRACPLGRDRYHRRYWLLPHTRGLLLEPPILNDFVVVNEEATSDDTLHTGTNMEVTDEFIRIFEKEPWRRVTTTLEFDSLLNSLCVRGLREKALKTALEQRREAVTRSINASRKKTGRYWVSKKVVDDTNEHRLALARVSLLDLEDQLWQGSIIDLEQREQWRAGVVQALSVQDLGVALLALQLAMPVKFMKPATESSTDFYLGPALPEVGNGVTADSSLPPVSAVSGSPEPAAESAEAGADELDTMDLPLERPYLSNVEMWRVAVAECNSYARLFLCIQVLSDTVLWSKSVLKARCKLCRKGTKADEMLLCDKCDEGFHMFCLTPPLKRVPEGDWFCPKCQPKTHTPRKTDRKRKLSDDEQVEEAADEDAAAPPKKKGSSVKRKLSVDDEPKSKLERVTTKRGNGKKPSSAVPSCTSRPRKGKRSRSESPTSIDSSGDDDDEEDEHEDTCGFCGGAGELICCDVCPKAFHRDCAQLPRVPRGDWVCPECKEAVNSAVEQDGGLSAAAFGTHRKRKNPWMVLCEVWALPRWEQRGCNVKAEVV